MPTRWPASAPTPPPCATACACAHSDGPLFGIVSRLVHQKGLDLVAEAAHEIVEQGGQIAVLGLGDPEIEHVLCRTSRRHRDDIGVLVGFNEQMARRIIAGSDFCLMPSRFEPCGLTQMQAQRYGALPIAHATGGLADTIDDGETGFLFSGLSSDGLMSACDRAFDAFYDEDRLAAMRQAAMARRFDWSGAAAQYAALYGRLCGQVVPVEVGRRGAGAPARGGFARKPVSEAGGLETLCRRKALEAAKAAPPPQAAGARAAGCARYVRPARNTPRSQSHACCMAAPASSTTPTQKKNPWFMPAQRLHCAGTPAARSFARTARPRRTADRIRP